MLYSLSNFGKICSKNITKYQLPANFSIISDDCWGGQIYIHLVMPYLTPTVGLWIEGDDYFNFLTNLTASDATEFYSYKSEESYPVGQTPYAKLNFLHYEGLDEAIETFRRRYQRINWNNLFYKIDLEKPCYSKEHVSRWNDLGLPNSIAFYSDKVVENWGHNIHNGIYIKNWVIDGAKMFEISRIHLNIYGWIIKGIVNSTVY